MTRKSAGKFEGSIGIKREPGKVKNIWARMPKPETKGGLKILGLQEKAVRVAATTS